MTDIPSQRLWQSMTTADAEHIGELNPVVVLPLAAIEQHGPHLPLSTDFEIGRGLLAAALDRLSADFPVRVLPPQAVGASLEHMRFAGTLSVEPDLLTRVIVSHGAAVARVGVKRFVLFNSHGGNKHVIEGAALRLRHDHGLLVVAASYFNMARPPDVELPPGEWRHGLHGGAVETAMMLHLRPDLVRTREVRAHASFAQELEKANSQVGTDTPGRFAWLAGDLNPSGAVGDASLASAAMGKRFVEHYGALLAQIIQDARAFPVDRLK